MKNTAIEVIRHSLNAATAALSLLEVEPVVQDVVVETAPAAEPALVEDAFCGTDPRLEVAEPVWTPSVEFDALMSELKFSDYSLRTTNELACKIGVSTGLIKQLLSEADIDFVIKHRRSDGAELIGLESRN